MPEQHGSSQVWQAGQLLKKAREQAMDMTEISSATHSWAETNDAIM